MPGWHPLELGGKLLQICVASDPSGLAEIWQVMERDGHSLPFQSFQWIVGWCRNFAGTAEPLLVTVLLDGAPLMLLPLCRVRRHGAHWLEFADLGFSDYNAPLIARDCPAGVLDEIEPLLRAILDELPPIDIVNLEKMPDRIGDIANPLARLACARYPMAGHVVPLASFERVVGKKQQRRRRRRLLELGVVEVREGAADAATNVDLLFALKRQRFDAPWLKEARVAAFYADLLGSGGARLFLLLLDGEVIAARYVLFGRDCAVALISGFDNRWDKYAPGTLLMAEVADACIAAGYRSLDLGVGDEPYKLALHGAVRPLYGYRAGRTVLGNGLIVLARLRRMIRRIVRPDIWRPRALRG